MVWKAQHDLVFSYFETYSYISALSLDCFCTGPFPTVWVVSFTIFPLEVEVSLLHYFKNIIIFHIECIKAFIYTFTSFKYHNLLTHVQLFAIPWTAACQAPLSMEFFRQEYWSGLPFPSPGDLPHPGIESRSPVLQADSLPSEPPGKSLWKEK